MRKWVFNWPTTLSTANVLRLMKQVLLVVSIMEELVYFLVYHLPYPFDFNLYWTLETVRSCSIDSLEWTRAMVDSSVSREEKLQKLQKAINSHSDYMKRAVDGKGIDRVFLGIRSVRKPDEPMPAMFTDPLWRESTRFRVSTSNVPSKNFIAGFGPTEPDGYGICYATRADVLQFSVCSLRNCSKTNTQQFRDSLSSALDLMRSLFKETSKL